ncbi:hemolytic lectin-S1 [Paramuricea clavata]|uniref:Hemolytic lectin-S1 n=1 Tax=Paramuricea clavata TaxID=317549 RepID=A0A6S7H574_PARCT|nr:hemolytic lectin-S1 [Paramuricea clavata]
MCEDGTIRNSKTPYNCFTPGTDGNGNLVSTSCQLYPAIPNYQKWRYGRSKTFVDRGGIRQEAREIINVQSGACMDIEDYDGNGGIGTYRCENLDDQYFYFRSRGTLLGHGRLQVEKSGLCLDVEGDQGRGNVLIDNCQNAADQYFNFYQNGELVNKKSGLCVDIEDYNGYGDITMHACEDLPNQMWIRPRHYCHGDYCSIRSKKSGQCVDVDDYDASKGRNVASYHCEGAPDQRFRWVDKKWVTPSAT